MNLLNHFFNLVPAKIPTTDDWLTTFKQLYDEVETINDILLNNSRNQDTSFRQKKIEDFAALRADQEAAVDAAVRTNDRAKIVATICEAIERLENENFISSDIGEKKAQDLTSKINSAKIPLRNQMRIDQAAAKGSKKIKELEDRQLMPPPAQKRITKRTKLPVPTTVDPQPGPSGTSGTSGIQRQPSSQPIPVNAPSEPNTPRQISRNEIEATKALIAPRLERLRMQFKRSPDRHVVSTNNMINASIRTIASYNIDNIVSPPLANELPSPRTSISEAKVLKRIDEIRMSKAMGEHQRGL